MSKGWIKKNDILVVKDGATTGKVSYIPENFPHSKAVINEHVFRCKVFEEIDSKFVFLYMWSERGKRQILSDFRGAAQGGISTGFVNRVIVPLPPLPEQKRIVAKIEELFSDLDKAVESLKKAQAQLKTYRQAVLKYAFEGRLTHKNIKPGQLPEGWKWVKLGDVAETCLGKMLDKQKNKGEFEPYLRNISVRWFEFNLTDLEKMRFTKDENVRYSVEYNDLVVCEGGEPGRAAIWKDKSSSIKIQKALHRVRFGSGAIPDYFLYFLYLTAHNGVLKKYFTGTTIKHLTGKRLNEVVFPLTTVAEQKSIVAEIETRLSEADYMEKTIIQSIEKAEATRQSILKKAFEGRLV